MCDSFVTLAPVTASRATIFAKSADCQINEAHHLMHLPRRKHVPGEMVRLTHIVIPQPAETYEAIISKSFWTYGAEIGVNEYGLAIGNEAVYTTLQKEEKTDGIIGIDMLRLALERAKSAREAIEVIGALLKQYGQGGNCELPGNSHFDINYLLADPQEAWILETAGREWAARRVDGIGSISNAFQIGTDWELCSVTGSRESLDWNASYGDQVWVPKLGARERQAASYNCLSVAPGKVNVRTFFNALRDHGELSDPAGGEVVKNICVHAGPAENRGWQATGALVAELKPGQPLAWVTGTSGTCLSIFKPVFLGVELPEIGPAPSEHYDPRTLWWEHELLHRRVMADFQAVEPEIRAEFDCLETEFINEAESAAGGTPALKAELMDYCFQRARYAERRWIDKLAARTGLHFGDPQVAGMWRQLNSAAGIEGMPA